MRICHILNEIKFSGAEIMIADSSHLFRSSGLELKAIATGRSLGEYAQIFLEKGIDCEHISVDYGMNVFRMFSRNLELYRYFKREKIDVVHVHVSHLWMVCVVAFLAGARCVKSQHNVFRNRWFTLPVAIAQRFIVRKVFGVVFHSIGESVERNERDYYRNTTVRVNNWYDAKRFFPAVSENEKREMRDQLGVSQDALVLISVGSCTSVKNHQDILHAMGAINGAIDCVYLHLGCGETECDEKMLAAKLGIMGNVQFLGNQKDVRKYLVASDIFVMPSRFEGLGNSALEAMACGLPMIVYDVPGLRDLVVDDDAGFLIPESHAVMAEKILELSEKPELRQNMGRRAIQRANHEYSMEKSVENFLTLYRTIE